MKRLALTILALALTGCGPSLRLKDVHREPAGPFDRMLVLSLMGQDLYREQAEDRMVQKIRQAGGQAEPRRMLFRGGDPADREAAVARITASDFDGVLLLQLGAITASDRGEERGRLPLSPHGDYEDWVGYALTGTTGQQRAENVSVDVVITLYDVAGRKRVWSADATVQNPGSPAALIETVTDEVLHILERGGYLP